MSKDPSTENPVTLPVDQMIPTQGPLSVVQPETQDARFEAFRNFLDDWDAGEGPRREKNKKLEEERKKAAQTRIYSNYIDHAAAEDTELVGRWTETLNILLTFAGLQSAIVVAFILILQPSLEPDGQDTSNQLLLRILHQLDNSTTLPASPAGTWTAPSNVVQILSWWYISFCCSLLSAFGALLSKQWIMQYQSQPAWANSNAKRAQLREIRYQGLTTWWFFGVIESLPILLQLSLLLFAIGLAEYLRTTSSPLFVIVATFMGIGGVFYVFTLVAGALFPSCPFKSPVSAVWVRAGQAVITFTKFWAISLLPLLLIPVMGIFGLSSELREMWRMFKDLWAYFGAVHIGYIVEKRRGESSKVGAESAGAAGIFCWWLNEDDAGLEDEEKPEAVAAVDIITALPPTITFNAFQKTGSFEFWVTEILTSLQGAAPLTTRGAKATFQQSETLKFADLAFHFMYHSPLADYVAFTVWRDEEYDFHSVYGLIREAWSGGDIARRLPTPTMRWSTVAVYLRYQLRAWCSTHKSEPAREDRENRKQIVEELPALLEDSRLSQNTADVANVAALAAVAFVEDDTLGVGRRSEFTREGVSQYEQLFLALRRLSLFVPSDISTPNTGQQSTQPTEKLFALLMKASRISMPTKHKILLDTSERLIKYPSMENNELGEAILRLLDLGVLYRERVESSPPPDLCRETKLPEGNSNGILVREMYNFIFLLFQQFSVAPKVYPGGLARLSSPQGLARLFAGYTHKDAVMSFDQAALRVINYVLGLRYHRAHSNSHLPFTKLPKLPVSLHPNPILPTSFLKDNTRILPTLLHDIQEVKESTDIFKRRLVLSVIVRGRDLFFPPDLGDKYPDLLQDVTSYAEAMNKSGSFMTWVPEVQTALNGFQKWDEMLRALGDLDALVSGREDEGKKSIGPDLEAQTPDEIQVLQSTPEITAAVPKLLV